MRLERDKVAKDAQKVLSSENTFQATAGDIGSSRTDTPEARILREKKNGISSWSAVLSWITKNPHHRCRPPIRLRLPSHFQKPDGEIPSYSVGS
jgi:hypothetical protein